VRRVHAGVDLASHLVRRIHQSDGVVEVDVDTRVEHGRA
jgi:hypothetical protein